MNIVLLVLKNLKSKPATSLMSLLLLTLGVGIISLLLLLSHQLEEKFQKNISGIGMVVGAKGSPLQLILSAVFQIDNPTGNIPYQEAQKLARNRYVSKVIPLAYGDSYRGYRIVGTDSSYLNHYNAKFAEGEVWQHSYEVVVGATAAKVLQLKLDDQFLSSHGLIEEGGMEHESHPLKVTGILQLTNSVADQLILTSVESIWDVHAHAPNQQADTTKELTALLVDFRNPMGLLTIPRIINERTTMQAAIPSNEVMRLFNLLGVGLGTLKAVAFAIILISGISFFLALYNSLRERKYELALMRSMGASRFKIFNLVIQEGLYLSFGGYVLGILLGHFALWLLSYLAEQNYHYAFNPLQLLNEELELLLWVVLVGITAALIPAIKAFRTPISETLAEA